MTRCVLHLAAEFLSFCILAASGLGQLPPGEHLVEPAGVAVNSKGHIYGGYEIR